jgi:hypothetical protein
MKAWRTRNARRLQARIYALAARLALPLTHLLSL